MSDMSDLHDEIDSSNALLRAKGIHRNFSMGDKSLKVLKGIDLSVRKGEDVCIVGASGSGKSTLLHILGTLDRPTLGRVYFKGTDLVRKTDEELARFRNRSLGFVFQFHHLLGEFTALENVMLPLRIGELSDRDARQRAEEILRRVDIGDRLNHFPSELSGGEKQRVAIARALVCEPEILMADEPTGNLDTENSLKVQELFFELRRELRLTLIIVTHDSNFAKRFTSIYRLKDGQWE